jgi:hypothetical protein
MIRCGREQLFQIIHSIEFFVHCLSPRKEGRNVLLTFSFGFRQSLTFVKSYPAAGRLTEAFLLISLRMFLNCLHEKTKSYHCDIH